VVVAAVVVMLLQQQPATEIWLGCKTCQACRLVWSTLAGPHFPVVMLEDAPKAAKKVREEAVAQTKGFKGEPVVPRTHNMVSLLQSLGWCTLHAVCFFLDPSSLGSIEAAAFDRYGIDECWKALRVAAERQLMCRPWWRKPSGQPVLPAKHKHALRELILQLNYLTSVPESWKDSICKRSETVIEIQPRRLAEPVSTIRGPHHGGTEDNVWFFYAGDQQQGWQSGPPAVATVPLSRGGWRGDTLAVGIQLVSQSLSCVGEAFLLGAEFHNVQGRVFTVCFSPVSGRVFTRFPAGEGMVAQGLPDLIATADATEVVPLEMRGIEAFMFVSTSCGMSFGRRHGDGSEKGDVEWSREIYQEFLSPFSVDKYASLTFQVDKLLESTQISITWAGKLLPMSAALPTSRHTFDGVWRNYEW